MYEIAVLTLKPASQFIQEVVDFVMPHLIVYSGAAIGFKILVYFIKSSKGD